MPESSCNKPQKFPDATTPGAAALTTYDEQEWNENLPIDEVVNGGWKKRLGVYVQQPRPVFPFENYRHRQHEVGMERLSLPRAMMQEELEQSLKKRKAVS